MNWLISANSKYYNYEKAFNDFSYIDWIQSNKSISKGDIVYIYCTKPIQKILYKCRVDKTNMKFSEIRNDKDYWNDFSSYEKGRTKSYMKLTLLSTLDTPLLSLSNLKDNGLKAAPQGPMKIKEKLLSYIETTSISLFSDSKLTEELPKEGIFEGLKKSIVVNTYERSSKVREEAIKYHGTKCCVCNFDFFNFYGEIGKDYIHIHHLTPLHEIDKEYIVDYIKDLRPVCPNCHSMLHRNIVGKTLTIEELREIIHKNQT